MPFATSVSIRARLTHGGYYVCLADLVRAFNLGAKVYYDFRWTDLSDFTTTYDGMLYISEVGLRLWVDYYGKRRPVTVGRLAGFLKEKGLD